MEVFIALFPATCAAVWKAESGAFVVLGWFRMGGELLLLWFGGGGGFVMVTAEYVTFYAGTVLHCGWLSQSRLRYEFCLSEII